MEIPFTIEQKVYHHEWEEVTLDAETFFANWKLLCGDDRHYDLQPTFQFEHGSVYANEIWRITDDGRLSTSSGQEGVMDWDKEKQAYVKHYYFRETVLGQFVSASFTLTDDLREILGLPEKGAGSA